MGGTWLLSQRPDGVGVVRVDPGHEGDLSREHELPIPSEAFSVQSCKPDRVGQGSLDAPLGDAPLDVVVGLAVAPQRHRRLRL